MNLNDTQKQARVDEILTTFIVHIKNNVGNASFTLTSLKFLSKLAHENELVKNWLHENMADIQVNNKIV